MEIGDTVTYTDQFGKKFNGLITAMWNGTEPPAAINIVYVVDDDSKTDQYGRQIERATSVVGKAVQSAPGRYYELTS